MTTEQLSRLIETVLSPANFFVGTAGRLRSTYSPSEICAWELFQGHLLAATQTRQTKEFQAWNVYLDQHDASANEPLISLKWNRTDSRLYVVRNILSHTWEIYESRPQVIESRPTQRWLPELVATIPIESESDDRSTLRLMQKAVQLAVLGVSRLPITSPESSLPAFTFGEFSYCPTAGQANPLRALTDPAQMIEQWWAAGESLNFHAQSLVLETVLRAATNEDIPSLARRMLEQWTAHHQSLVDVQHVVYSLFHRLSLSPYTGFVDNWICLLRTWSAADMLGVAAVIDVISYVLRHLVRHLTAYDLNVFHNLGANYPDALLLDAMFGEYIGLAARRPDLFLDETGADHSGGSRIRRRALRQAWLCRTQYDGHLVPDRPTSPGENQRVMPDGLTRVPDEQLVDPRSRRKRLFDGRPTESLVSAAAKAVLNQSLCDLADDRERRELGMAVFLDRPLGVLKPPGETDRTVLLSYPAFSQSIAQTRWDWLRQQPGVTTAFAENDLHASWAAVPRAGFAVSRLGATGRHGVVALEDAFRVAEDFVFLRTTGSSLDELMQQYDFTHLQGAIPDLILRPPGGSRVLFIRTTPTVHDGRLQLTAFCASGQPLFGVVAESGPRRVAPYVEIAGTEYLTNLRIERVWPQAEESARAITGDATGLAIPAKSPVACNGVGQNVSGRLP